MKIRRANIIWQLAACAVLGNNPCALAKGPDFYLDGQFFARQPAASSSEMTIEMSKLKALPAMSIGQLTALVQGKGLLKVTRKVPDPAGKLAKDQPLLVKVQSPHTQNLTVDVAMRERTDTFSINEDESVLAEGARLLHEDVEEHGFDRIIFDKKKENIQSPKISSKERVKMNSPLFGAKNLPILTLASRQGQLQISPSQLDLKVGSSVQVVYSNLPSAPKIFIRDSRRLAWDAQAQILTSVRQGKTELFITYRDQLYILPIEASLTADRGSLLSENKESLYRLTSILPENDSEMAHFVDSTGERANRSDFRGMREEEATEARADSKPLTLATAAAEVDAVHVRTVEQQARFGYDDESTELRRVSVQILDERSAPEQKLVYPVSGVTVKLLGTSLAVKTDSRGQALFGEVPVGSRFWAAIDDDQGRIVPTVSELSLAKGQGAEVLRARALSYRSYMAYMNILDIAQDTQLGSICGRVLTRDGHRTLAGVAVSINVSASGPYYFGSFGPQKDLEQTEDSGRFCYFNVAPGLAELTFSSAGDLRTALSLPIFPGAHSEEDFPLENSVGRRVFLASMPSATEQVYSEQGTNEASYEPINQIELLSIGDNEPFQSISPFVLGSSYGATSFKGRIYALAQAPEFENVLYGLDRDKDVEQSLPVLPLFQRGFVEDLYQELSQADGQSSIPFDPAMGQALVFHHLGAGEGNVKIKLVDGYGRLTDEAWYFGQADQSVIKSVFFNLKPGNYLIRVESAQGALLALDSFAVDYWTTAFVQTGSSLRYSLRQGKREDEINGSSD